MSEASESSAAAAPASASGGNTYGELVAILTAVKNETNSVVGAIQDQTSQISEILHSLVMNQVQQAETQNALTQEIIDLLTEILATFSPPVPVAVAAVLTIEGDPMPLTIDSVNAQAVLTFEDRDGDPVPAPSGAVSTATSDNTAVLVVGAETAGTDANGNPAVLFPLTEVSAGTANLSVASTDASGNALTYTGPDGTTANIADPAPIAVTVNPGAAAQEVFTVPGN
jgi:hypothetical protein